MKINKILTKTVAATAMSAVLLCTVASASTVKVPNTTGVTVQYSNMVQAANSFDSSLGNLIADAFTKACYTKEAIDTAITNTNNAINAINNITFFNSNNKSVSSGGTFTVTNKNIMDKDEKPIPIVSFVRDNGSLATANNYLKAAQLTGGVLFSLTSSTEGESDALSYTADRNKFKYDKAVKVKAPTSEYYDTVNFKVSTSLYAAGETIKVIQPDINDNNTKYDGSYNSITFKKNSISDITSKLNKYVTFLNAVKAFDEVAGCYDGTSSSNTTSNTTAAPTNANAVINARNKTLSIGDTFKFMDGVSATDANGSDLTNKVTVSGTVNTAKAGSYTLTYKVKGANGVSVSRAVTVTVK